MPGLSGSPAALRIRFSRVRRRLDHCTGPYSTIWLPGSNRGPKSRCITPFSSGSAAAGNRQPVSSGARWPVWRSTPPPGPSSSTQPGLTSTASSPRWRVQLLPDTSRMRQISSPSCSWYSPLVSRSWAATVFAFSFSRSAFIGTSPLFAFSSVYHVRSVRASRNPKEVLIL